MTDIADRAGYAKQTVYNRYGVKAAILAAIVDCVQSALAEALMEEGISTRVSGPASAESGARQADRTAELAAAAHSQLERTLRRMLDAWPAMVRLALTIRCLPWIARRTARSRARLEKVLRYHFDEPGLAGPNVHRILCSVACEIECSAPETAQEPFADARRVFGACSSPLSGPAPPFGTHSRGPADG